MTTTNRTGEIDDFMQEVMEESRSIFPDRAAFCDAIDEAVRGMTKTDSDLVVFRPSDITDAQWDWLRGAITMTFDVAMAEVLASRPVTVTSPNPITAGMRVPR